MQKVRGKPLLNSSESSVSSESAAAPVNANPLQLSQEEITEWSSRSQAIHQLSCIHFAAFNAMERATLKRERARHAKAVKTIWHAALYLRGEEYKR